MLGLIPKASAISALEYPDATIHFSLLTLASLNVFLALGVAFSLITAVSVFCNIWDSLLGDMAPASIASHSSSVTSTVVLLAPSLFLASVSAFCFIFFISSFSMFGFASILARTTEVAKSWACLSLGAFIND